MYNIYINIIICHYFNNVAFSRFVASVLLTISVISLTLSIAFCIIPSLDSVRPADYLRYLSRNCSLPCAVERKLQVVHHI